MMTSGGKGIPIESVTEGVYIYNYEDGLAYPVESWNKDNSMELYITV